MAYPLMGTNFFDGVRIGAIPTPDNSTYGIYEAPLNMYKITPVALVVNSLVAAVTPAQAGYLTIKSDASTTTETITVPTLGTITVQTLDVPRAVGVNVPVSTSTAVTVTVWGFDVYNVLMSETITVPISGAPATLAGKKAFKKIYRAYVSGAPGGNISLGQVDIFGLPYYFSDFGDIIAPTWNDVVLTTSAFTVGDTTTATATTGDVRGTFTAPNAADAAKVLTALMYVQGAANNNTVKALQYGVTQFAQSFI